jgi:hypothetical protein
VPCVRRAAERRVVLREHITEMYRKGQPVRPAGSVLEIILCLAFP